MVAEAVLRVRIPASSVRFIIYPSPFESEDAADERQWDAAFATSLDVLKRLGDKALAEYQAGKTEPLDPDRL